MNLLPNPHNENLAVGFCLIVPLQRPRRGGNREENKQPNRKGGLGRGIGLHFRRRAPRPAGRSSLFAGSADLPGCRGGLRIKFFRPGRRLFLAEGKRSPLAGQLAVEKT